MRNVKVNAAIVLSAWLYIGAAAAAPLIPPAHLIAGRSNGVAPLAVFFDASDTTSDVTAIPFHDLGYRWDFGDPGSGVWSTDGKSRNVATGPVAAHVFESPGEYAVTLTVRDSAGTEAVREMMITVADPAVVFAGANTVCFSRDGDFSGAPAGALLVTTTEFKAVAARIATGKRLLLRRGQTWDVSSGVSLNVSGPGIFGAFGAGNRPVLRALSNATAFALSAAVSRLDDWRIMDIEVDGNSQSNSRAVAADGTVTRTLLLRLAAHDMRGAVLVADSILNYNNSQGYTNTLHDQFAVVDATFTHFIGGSGGNIMYIAAQRFALLGSVLWDSENIEHVLRTPWIATGVISHNDMRRQAVGKHVVKMHAPPFYGSGLGSNQYTERVLLSDNYFLGNADWTVAIGPSSSSDDARARDVIVERNFFVHNTNVQVGLLIWAREVTIRNNIFDVSDGMARTCMSIGQRGIEPVACNVRVYNNTGCARVSNSFVLAGVQSITTNVTLRNNLGFCPRLSTAAMYSGTGVNFVADHNLLTNRPGFVVSDPVNPDDFRLSSASPAVDAGTNVSVFEDYALNPRPAARCDCGAFALPEPCCAILLAGAAVVCATIRRVLNA